ncbi:MAG: PTS sugar transporter subunit IIA [Caldithrix sp.]|nr:PTS sugar transporter subunit IIA [Caldithrix sp.]
MDISKHLPPEHITLDIKSNLKFDVIEELLSLLDENKQLLNKEVTLKDLLAREGYLSTGLEKGLAVPHAKSDGVDQLLIAMGIKKDGLDFESLDGKPAQVIFLVLSPRDTSGPHIQSLATISRNYKSDEIRQALLNAKTPEAVAEIIKEQFTQ